MITNLKYTYYEKTFIPFIFNVIRRECAGTAGFFAITGKDTQSISFNDFRE
jgi:hypothetical protein